MEFNINTDEAVVFTNKLEKIRKDALPDAIRGTLNDAAFDVKTNTMLKSSEDAFENRQKNFFKANSRFEKAVGRDISSMKSVVGFVEKGLRGENNYSVSDLEQQEKGGVIDKKSFIPLNTARVSKSNKKLVKPNARLKSINKIVNYRNQKGANKKEKFVNAVLKAGAGGFVLGSTIKGENISWRVNSLSSKLKTRNLDLTPLYDYQKDRSVRVQKTSFMEKASINTADKMPLFYGLHAKKQINKLV